MENQIDNIVEQIFKKEFFCEDVETAKEKVIAAFRKKYEELLPEHTDSGDGSFTQMRIISGQKAAFFRRYIV